MGAPTEHRVLEVHAPKTVTAHPIDNGPCSSTFASGQRCELSPNGGIESSPIVADDHCARFDIIEVVSEGPVRGRGCVLDGKSTPHNPENPADRRSPRALTLDPRPVALSS